MTIKQQIKTYGVISPVCTQQRNTNILYNQNTIDRCTAQILSIFIPYMKYQITDNQIISIQKKINNILSEYKKVKL